MGINGEDDNPSVMQRDKHTEVTDQDKHLNKNLNKNIEYSSHSFTFLRDACFFFI